MKKILSVFLGLALCCMLAALPVCAEEAVEAVFALSRMEGIVPALESPHAVAYAMRLAKEMKTGSILVNLSGRGDKDMDYILERYPEKL